jgi:hypothetical protein
MPLLQRGDIEVFLTRAALSVSLMRAFAQEFDEV